MADRAAIHPITEEQMLECLELGYLSEDHGMLEVHKAVLRSLEQRGLVKRVWVLTGKGAASRG